MITRLISPFYQRTIHNPFYCTGYGLQTGLKIRMRVMPSEANTGYTFIRHDVDTQYAKVIANHHNVTDSRLSTTITNSHGIEINSVNYILAALYACNINNARIILEGSEVPNMDGSAIPFVKLIQKAGFIQQNAERAAIVIKRPITISDDANFTSFLPNRTPWASIAIFSLSKTKQVYSSILSEDIFTKDIAPVHSFSDREEINKLLQSGRAQGVSSNNTNVLENDYVTNKENLSYGHEFIRYRILEHIANLALVGATIFGDFSSACSSFKFNNVSYGNWLKMNKDSLQHTTLKLAQTRYQEILIPT